jgi:hypothetical protein
MGGKSGGGASASGGGGGDPFAGTDLSGPQAGNSGDMFSGGMNQSGDFFGPGGGEGPGSPTMVSGTVNDPTVQAPIATAGGATQAAVSGPQGPGAGSPGAGQQSGPPVPPIADLLGIGDELKGLRAQASPKELAAAGGTGAPAAASDPGWWRGAAPARPGTDPLGNTYNVQPGYQASPMSPLPPYPGGAAGPVAPAARPSRTAAPPTPPAAPPSAPAPTDTEPTFANLPPPAPSRATDPEFMGPEFNEAFGTTPDQIASGTVPVRPTDPLTSIARSLFGPRSWDEMMKGNFFGPYGQSTTQQPPGTDSPNAGNAPATAPAASGSSAMLPEIVVRPPGAPGSLGQAAAQAGYPAPAGGGYGGGPQPGAAELEPAQTISPATAAEERPAAAGENPLEPPIKPVDPTKPTTYVGGQYYQGGNRVSGPSPADGQSARPSAPRGPSAPDAQVPGQAGYQPAPPAAVQPPAQLPAGPGAAPTGGQQGINPIQAIIDLFTKGPGAFMDDLAGVARQALPGGYDPSTGRYQYAPTGGQTEGNQPAPAPAEDERQQAEQRRQDLGQGGTYILNDQGQRVRVQTNPDGSTKVDAQGNPIPATDAQQGARTAPGAAVTRGSYPALNTRVTTNHPVSLGPVNQGLQDTLAAGAQQFENNNPGYKVQVMSGHRGGNDPHGRNNAVDLQIIGPNGAIANAGADTTGKYTELARNMLGAQRALHPELNNRFMWGGYFNADGAHGFADPRTGANRPDLMHFDLEGGASRRTAMRDRYYGLGATGNYGGGQQGVLRPPGNIPDAGTPAGHQAYVNQTIQIESGWKTGRANYTGSNKGLAQFGPEEERMYGLNASNRDDPRAVSRALAMENDRNRPTLSRVLGREPTGEEYYLAHQQGLGGAVAHFSNPNAPAWQNMYSTAEGRQKGAGWAQRAITGNIPRDNPLHNVPVNQITSKQFTDMWAQRFNRGAAISNQPAAPQRIPTQPAPAPAQGGSQRAGIMPTPKSIPRPNDTGGDLNQMLPDIMPYGPNRGVPRETQTANNLARRYGLDWV